MSDFKDCNDYCQFDQMKAEIDTLRRENERLASMPYASESARAVAYGKQIDTLRELVREAYKSLDSLSDASREWFERAEKALGD
jgi:plasmid stabilization system protein ParE